jgi:hypothetical protein
MQDGVRCAGMAIDSAIYSSAAGTKVGLPVHSFLRSTENETKPRFTETMSSCGRAHDSLQNKPFRTPCHGTASSLLWPPVVSVSLASPFLISNRPRSGAIWFLSRSFTFDRDDVRPSTEIAQLLLLLSRCGTTLNAHHLETHTMQSP